MKNTRLKTEEARPHTSLSGEARAKEKIVELLARRDHSRKELAQKLIKREFEIKDIEAAILWAEEHNLLRSPQELSEATFRRLSAKYKGQNYINQYLKQRGLPLLKADPMSELEKADKIAQQYLNKSATLDQKTRAKIGRRLLSRGFDMATVRKVLYERLKSLK